MFIPLLNLLSFHSLLALQTSTVVPKQTPCLPLATFRLKSLSFPDHQIPITDFIWNNLLWIQCRPTLTFLPTSASLNYEESTWTHLLIQPRKSAKFFFLFFALMQILSKPLTLHFPFRPRLWQLIRYAVILKIVLLNNSVLPCSSQVCQGLSWSWDWDRGALAEEKCRQVFGRQGCYPAGSIWIDRWAGLAVITRACRLLAKKLGGILIPEDANPGGELTTYIPGWQPTMDSAKVSKQTRVWRETKVRELCTWKAVIEGLFWYTGNGETAQ